MKAWSSFPDRLARWRNRRGLSQLQLAMATLCSQRHISFLELGRTKPSRDGRAPAAALDMPLRQSKELLLAAGFAPAWTEAALDAAALAPVRDALAYMLMQQEPFPAVVVDRRWNLLQANRGAVALVEFLVGPVAPGGAINLADALVAPEVLRPLRIESFFPMDEATRRVFRRWSTSSASPARSPRRSGDAPLRRPPSPGA